MNHNSMTTIKNFHINGMCVKNSMKCQSRLERSTVLLSLQKPYFTLSEDKKFNYLQILTFRTDTKTLESIQFKVIGR